MSIPLYVAGLVRVWPRFCIDGLQTFTLFHYDTTQGIATALLFHLPLAGSISDVLDYNRAGLTLQPVERACCCCRSLDMTGYCGLFARCVMRALRRDNGRHTVLETDFLLFPFIRRNGVLLLPSRPPGPLRSLTTQPQPPRALLQPPWYQRVSDDGPIGIPSGRAARSRDGKVDGCVQAMGACAVESWIKLNDDGRIERTRMAICIPFPHYFFSAHTLTAVIPYNPPPR
jgi:hypothetical protein